LPAMDRSKLRRRSPRELAFAMASSVNNFGKGYAV
jgi:hypothetical protein